MPTYQYRCKECDHELEVVQSFNDEPLTECPVCSGPLRKVYGAVGISFKGSGFYKTDSRNGSKSKSSKSSSSDSSSSSSPESSSKSSDSGTAAASSTTTSSSSSD
jgi:putative FmdB family regulatory protein